MYEVVAALGAGGMGEVYRARDTKLGRDVALKILPASFAGDPERVARFRREAQVLASLNHPGIAAIHGLEESGPTQFLVLELVEGGTLADRLRQGALPIDDALHIARQVAAALEAAHERGIIHRDLKPANIGLTAGDQVKVLDFGLAKAGGEASGHGDEASGRLANSPTRTSPVDMTQAGMILGTAAYMSPEQAKGRAVDKRADIWAFGCVLFEMLSGRTAFAGEDVLETLTAVMRAEPDWRALPPAVPLQVRAVLHRCLQKDARRRQRDIGDVRLDLDEGALAEALVALPQPSARALRMWQLAASVATIALLAGALGAWRTATPASIPPVTRFSFPLPAGQQWSRLGHQSVAISPDGTQVVYVADGRLYRRAMSEAEAREIPGTSLVAEHPAFSPDGRSLVFGSRTDGTLKRIAITGGAPVIICQAGAVLGLSWARDGFVYFAQEQGARGVLRVPADGGTPETVVTVKGREEVHGPELLPDGRHVLFTLARGTGASRWDGAEIVVQNLVSGERKTLITGGYDGRYLPTGHIVYGFQGVLHAAPFDPDRLAVTGGPVPVVEGVRASASISGSMQFSTAATGTLVYLPGPVGPAPPEWELVEIDRAGAVTRLALPPGWYANPRVSPDGTRLAVAVDDGKTSDIWTYDRSGASVMRRLTFGGHNRLPVWSADSRRIAFQSDRDGDEAVYAQPADGSGSAERLTTPGADESHAPESWSPDGAHIVFSATRGSTVTLSSIALVDRTAAPFGGVQSSEPTNAVFSPDGRWVAYTSTEGGGRRILVQPFPATGAKYEVSPSIEDAYYPMWATDGKELFWTGTGGLRVAAVSPHPAFSVGRPAVLPVRLEVIGPSVHRTMDVTPAGAFLGFLRSEAAQRALARPTQFEVVLNWFAELEARAPAR